MSLLKVFASTLVLTVAAHAQLSPDMKNQLTAEMKLIGSIFQNQYAPKQWKERHLGWSVEKELNTALTKIDAAASVQDYRSALKNFVQSKQDYHVSISFYSTERAALAFSVKTIEDKTLIVDIDRNKLSEEAFPFSVGDELLAIDNKPVSQVLKDIQASIGQNIAGTDQALADMYLLARSGRSNMKVPRGPVLLTLQRAKETVPTTFQLVWEYQKEQIPGRMSESFLESMPRKKQVMPLPMMTTQHVESFM